MTRALSFAHTFEAVSSLFNDCAESFNSIGIIDHGFDVWLLLFRLNIERCRFYIWFQFIKVYPDEVWYTASCASLKAAKRNLAILHQYFAGPRTREQFGCEEYVSFCDEQPDYTRKIAVLASYFDNFGSNSKSLKVLMFQRYAIEDQHKFLKFIAIIKHRIDTLQHSTKKVVTVAAHDQEMIRRIININDHDTLQMISQVCQQDYPDFTNAARNTIKLAASISIPANHWKVGRWIQDTEFVSAESTRPYPTSSDGYEDCEDGCPPDEDMSLVPSWFNEWQNTSNISRTSQECAIISDDSDTNRKSAKAIVIPIDVMGTNVQYEEYIHDYSINDVMIQATDGCSSDLQPQGFIEEELDDPTAHYAVSDTQCAASDTSSTIIAEDQIYQPKSSLNTGSRRRSSTNQNMAGASKLYTGKPPGILKTDSNSKISNGFMNLDIMCDPTNELCNDYFVLSFHNGRNDNTPRVGHCTTHTHYVGAHYAARFVHTKAYVAFDLETWPRDLQVGAFADAQEVDRSLVKAMRNTKLQVNVFVIPTLNLPFCSLSYGGCLRMLFDALAKGRSFATCLPAITMSRDGAPDVFMIPVGRKTFMPSFLLHQAPGLQPKADILLILMVFWK